MHAGTEYVTNMQRTYKSNHSSGAEHESDVTAHLYHRVRGASPLGDGHKSRS